MVIEINLFLGKEKLDMPKRLRDEPIYLAPKILGYRDDKYNPVIKDLRTDRNLDPFNLDDKILIYKQQVEEWFLNRAVILCRSKNNNFIVVMIATSYVEGVEQYRIGEKSNGHSRQFFITGLRRIFSLQNVTDDQLSSFYNHLRCGLFHNGMSGDKVVLNSTLINAIEFSKRETIDINPKLYLDAIIQDFNQYISDLNNQNNIQLRSHFNRMFTVV